MAAAVDPRASQRLLALRVRAVADATKIGDDVLLTEALRDLGALAFGWAEALAAKRG
jgi:hypothetical protein